MLTRILSIDAWLRGTVGLLIAHGIFFVVVQSRPGLVAVVLWYVVPVILVSGAACLLGIALIRSWQRRETPGERQLAGYAALLLVVGSLAVFRTYPSSHDATPSRIPFRVPLDGPVTVAWGGPTLAENYHAVMPDQRWAYDLLVTRDGKTHQGDGTRLDQFYAYGREVLAPAAGVVLHVEDGEPDGPIGQRRFFGAFGNHVVLEVAPREFLFIAHLQPRSIRVAPGDRVSAGDVTGRVGNSGNSSEPHLHVHLQDRPTPSIAEGIPFQFHDYRVNGSEIARGMPRGGRESTRRAEPGGFIGDVVEHVSPDQ
jgi:murein DD-endopeptidase MepM/ murein hydrolase activator NlpD